LFVLAACGSETTTFRSTDRGDGADRIGPPAAAYDLHAGGEAAHAYVWSRGGYISNTDEPMVDVGFEVHNLGKHPIVFDDDALALELFDRDGRAMSPASLVAVVPLGAAKVVIAPGATVMLEAAFQTPVRPLVIQSMRAHWSIAIGDARQSEVTSFVRDDAYPVLDAPTPTTGS